MFSNGNQNFCYSLTNFSDLGQFGFQIGTESSDGKCVAQLKFNTPRGLSRPVRATFNPVNSDTDMSINTVAEYTEQGSAAKEPLVRL